MDALARTLKVLGCVAADPGLNGVLLLDLDPSLLLPLGRWLAGRLGQSRVLTLGSSTTDEDLWVHAHLSGHGFQISPGLLVEEPRTPPPVVLVPDLCRAGLAVTRAALMLAGAGTASAEQLGHSFRWQPRGRWLAAADRTEVAQLSPHLLDRFPIRVNAAELRDFQPSDDDLLLPQPLPRMSAAALAQVIAVAPQGPSLRRDLALARVARALAAGESEVAPDHVAQAAELLGIDVRPDLPEVAAPTPTEPPTPALDLPSSSISDSQELGTPAPDTVPVLGSGPGVELEPLPVPAIEADPWPYPEDDPEALPTVASLRAGQRRPAGDRRRGQMIGIQATGDLHDLAVVGTVLEAAKFQTIRRRHVQSSQLIISPADLRRHRRQPAAAAALVLVLDHSCRRGWDWSTAMAPYLRWAYQQNAAVSVIEFGHRPTADELGAERYLARSMRDPRLFESLSREPGLASPLAHALDLAVQALRRFMRVPVDNAVLVVATDGRGNVPLEASLRGRVPSGTGRLGVTDALSAAAAVRTMPQVRTVVLAPDLDQYAELPFDLAVALGGQVIQAPEPDR
jgi:magnesium chelatase subunit D